MLKKLLVAVALVAVIGIYVAVQNPQKKSVDFQEHYEQATQLYEAAAETQVSETGLIESFFEIYNQAKFDGIYNQLTSDKIKTIKDRDTFVSNLSELHGLLGNYQSGRQTGSGSGMKWVLSTDTGEMLDEKLTLKTSKVTWQSNFDNGVYYFEFIFDKEGDDLSLFTIVVKDKVIMGEFKKAL